MKFTESHEWIEIVDGVGTVGVTDYAQKELGEIVYVELPHTGRAVNAGDEAVVLESTKAAADVYTPVSGEIIEVNVALNEQSELVNSAAETDGWLFKIKISKIEELENLMDETTYFSQIK